MRSIYMQIEYFEGECELCIAFEDVDYRPVENCELKINKRFENAY